MLRTKNDVVVVNIVFINKVNLIDDNVSIRLVVFAGSPQCDDL